VDRKHQEPVTGKLLTRLMILTNELPRLGDASGALSGRMIVLRMSESFYGREDIALTDKLLAERPGILLWAIEGWRRLRERGRFIFSRWAVTICGSKWRTLPRPWGRLCGNAAKPGRHCKSKLRPSIGRGAHGASARGAMSLAHNRHSAGSCVRPCRKFRRRQGREGDDRYRFYEGIALR